MRDLHDMTDRELYRLAFQVSEVLVERARIRLQNECIVGRYEIARPTMPAPRYVDLEAWCRDIGYGSEHIHGVYIATDEVDTWGKRTFLGTDGEPDVYLFADEIIDVIPIPQAGFSRKVA